MTKLVRPQKISDQVLAVLEERIATGIYEDPAFTGSAKAGQ